MGVNNKVEKKFWLWCEAGDYHDHHFNVAQQIIEGNFERFKDEAKTDVEHLLLSGFVPSSPIFKFVEVFSDQHYSLYNRIQTFFFLLSSSDLPVAHNDFPYRDSCRNEAYAHGNDAPVGASNYREGKFYYIWISGNSWTKGKWEDLQCFYLKGPIKHKLVFLLSNISTTIISFVFAHDHCHMSLVVW